MTLIMTSQQWACRAHEFVIGRSPAADCALDYVHGASRRRRARSRARAAVVRGIAAVSQSAVRRAMRARSRGPTVAARAAS